MDMGWMAWTAPTAIFFICIALMLAGMTVWEVVSPTVEAKGFLPMRTTRGDRLFIGSAAPSSIWAGSPRPTCRCGAPPRSRCCGSLS